MQQTFSDWASQVFRLYKGSRHLEVEYTVGHIPIGLVEIDLFLNFGIDNGSFVKVGSSIACETIVLCVCAISFTTIRPWALISL